MQPFRTQIVTASQGHIRRWAHVTAFRKVPAGVLKLVDKLDLGSSAYGVWVRVPSPAQRDAIISISLLFIFAILVLCTRDFPCFSRRIDEHQKEPDWDSKRQKIRSSEPMYEEWQKVIDDVKERASNIHRKLDGGSFTSVPREFGRLFSGMDGGKIGTVIPRASRQDG